MKKYGILGAVAVFFFCLTLCASSSELLDDYEPWCHDLLVAPLETGVSGHYEPLFGDAGLLEGAEESLKRTFCYWDVQRESAHRGRHAMNFGLFPKIPSVHPYHLIKTEDFFEEIQGVSRTCLSFRIEAPEVVEKLPPSLGSLVKSSGRKLDVFVNVQKLCGSGRDFCLRPHYYAFPEAAELQSNPKFSQSIVGFQIGIYGEGDAGPRLRGQARNTLGGGGGVLEIHADDIPSELGKYRTLMSPEALYMDGIDRVNGCSFWSVFLHDFAADNKRLSATLHVLCTMPQIEALAEGLFESESLLELFTWVRSEEDHPLNQGVMAEVLRVFSLL